MKAVFLWQWQIQRQDILEYLNTLGGQIDGKLQGNHVQRFWKIPQCLDRVFPTLLTSNLGYILADDSFRITGVGPRAVLFVAPGNIPGTHQDQNCCDDRTHFATGFLAHHR